MGSSISRHNWIVMAFAYKFRRRAAALPCAVARRSAAARRARIHELVIAFVSKIRRRADAAGAALGLLATAGLKRVASMPRPLIGFDVGVDSDLALVYRNELGQKSNVHPARAPDEHIPLGCALASDGSVCLPLSPPTVDSAFELCADASGAMCCYDRDLGNAQWEPPPGSTPLRTRLLLQPAVGAPDSPSLSTRLALRSCRRRPSRWGLVLAPCTAQTGCRSTTTTATPCGCSTARLGLYVSRRGSACALMPAAFTSSTF